ncbi:MAG: translation initiation factor [Muribaculaceae bacterium]|nr:translation initiation factor [Muribaculaceae bacterium]
MDWKEMLSQMKDSLPEEKNEVQEAPAKENETKLRKKEKLSISMERKGRGGKTATIIFGFEGNDEEVASTASILKQKLGIGGSARGGEILLQGDVREKVKPLLKEMGYGV